MIDMIYLFRPQLQRYNLIIKNLKRGSIADMGSNEGNLHEYILKNIPPKLGPVVGIDIEKGKNVDFVCNLNKKINFGDKRFDNVIAGELIEHLESPFNFLQGCHRLLKTGGRLILTTPNASGIQHIFPYNLYKSKNPHPHLYAWTMENLESLLEKVGFKIIKKSYLNVYYRTNLIFRFIGSLCPRIRPLLFFICDKNG